ncbi:MAG: diaminopimelate epimerase [Rickettsiales endosymbiont of Dermacentor nuttalli]
MSIINFIKMHGCGNDFVVIDTRVCPIIVFSLEIIKKITDRRYGIGCDQLILIEDSKSADCFMRIYNADGSEAGACGNASRCVASLLSCKNNKKKISIETTTNTVIATVQKNGSITIDMGVPKFSPADLKLLWEGEPSSLQIKVDHMNLEAVAVNVGNIHLICFFDYDIDKVHLESLANQVNNLRIFSEEVNISIININYEMVNEKFVIKIRTFERGAGETLSCGTAACAAAVSAIKKGYITYNSNVEVNSRGGILSINWSKGKNNVLITGEVVISFTGQITL